MNTKFARLSLTVFVVLAMALSITGLVLAEDSPGTVS
jgi:hypothetical protein